MRISTAKSSFVPAALFLLLSLSAAAADVVYVDSEDANTIVKVSANGAQTVIATAGVAGVDSPAGMACNPAGNLYVANQGVNYTGYAYINRYAPSGAGSLFTTHVVSPWGLACNGAGTLYEADTNGINMYTAQGARRSAYQGGQISLAESLAFDNAGNLYIGNDGTNVLGVAQGYPAVYATPPSGCVEGLAFDNAGDMFVSLSTSQFYPSSGPIYEYSAAGQWSLFASANAGEFAFDSAGNLDAIEGSEIVQYAPNGTPTVLTTGLDQPEWIAIDTTPEPATLALLALGGLALVRRRARRVSALRARQGKCNGNKGAPIIYESP